MRNCFPRAETGAVVVSNESAWRAINRAHWDEKVGIHLGPRGYDLTALREGHGRFYPIEEAELGPVAGKRVLHLQCHFGSDTLKFAQRGANAVGLDFSADAIAAAQRLAGELGLADRAHFVLADLYNAPAAIAEPAGFDIVFVSCDLLAARHPPMGRDRRPFLEAGRLFVPRRGASDGDDVRRCGDIARRAPRLFRAVSGARGGGHGADPRLH